MLASQSKRMPAKAQRTTRGQHGVQTPNQIRQLPPPRQVPHPMHYVDQIVSIGHPDQRYPGSSEDIKSRLVANKCPPPYVRIQAMEARQLFRIH